MESEVRAAVEKCLGIGLTFAAFRKPGEPVTIWAQRTPDLEVVDGALLWELNDVFLLVPFDHDPKRIPFIRSDVELTFTTISPDVTLLTECRGRPRTDPSTVSSTAKSSFTQVVDQVKRIMAAGGLEKVVLSRLEFHPIEPTMLPDLFLSAIHEMEHTMVAMVHTPTHGTWLGASPERLVVEDDDHVWVDAMAGTMTAGTAPMVADHWGAKERHEQELVSRHVREVLERLDLANITDHGPGVVKAGGVAHLVTTFEADLNDKPLSDLVLALHPTPAVCGTPMEAAREFIRAHGTHERSLYAGCWGPWKPDGRTDLYVNIRCLQAVEGGVAIHVGAGITYESDPEAEWQETAHKSRVWLDMIQRSRAVPD